jgi:hypothetical protein
LIQGTSGTLTHYGFTNDNEIIETGETRYTPNFELTLFSYDQQLQNPLVLKVSNSGLAINSILVVILKLSLGI